MAQVKSYLLGGATLVCALGIGYVMQYGTKLPGQDAPVEAELQVTDITEASSAFVAPQLPDDLELELVMPDQTVALAAATEPEVAPLDLSNLPPEPAQSGFDCETVMLATPIAGAMVDITLDAACHASERVTIHHHGMMFTEVMQPDGTLNISVPAMSDRAMFIAAFADGEGATASADVTSLEFYDRVAVQWKGEAGLQLHAREFSADYFADGHVWAAAAGDLTAAARGEGGFLTRLGREDAPEALMVEVYSFPTGTATRGGDVLVTVEAEVTDSNCAAQIEAQTFELHSENGLRVRDMTLDMPDCDSVGDFLVLKNLIEDLTIASR